MPPQQGQYILSSGTFPVGQRTDVARVLLAEDDIHLLRLIARLLRSAGIEVETAATPSAALELISALGFDLILSDLFAPEMSGAKIVAAVRLFDPLLPIVIISGDTEACHRRHRRPRSLLRGQAVCERCPARSGLQPHRR